MEIKKYYIYDYNNKDKTIPNDYLINLFNNNNKWERVDETNNLIDFSYAIGMTLKNKKKNIISYRFTSKHQNYLTNKAILYETINNNFSEIAEKYMMFQTRIDINNLDQYKTLFQNKKYYILKPTWTFERRGIHIFDSFNSFKNYMLKKGIYEYNRAISRDNKNALVLAEYNTDLLTYNDRIIDLRVFFLVSYINNIYRGYIIKPIIMNMAPYKKSDKFNPNNMLENITHPFGYEDYYLNDLKKEIGKDNTKFIMTQIKYILSHILKLIKKYKIMLPYENEETFELFGVDFIVDKNYNVKLVEFNEKTGLKNYSNNIYRNISAGFIHSTINKKYENTEYEIKIDDKIKKNIVRINTYKKYTMQCQI
jgi:hypothetical protein